MSDTLVVSAIVVGVLLAPFLVWYVVGKVIEIGMRWERRKR